ncbi:regulatory protein, IclR [Nitratireductor indicus C115]|uniref:Regulatory protein, IclR n=1 Tax=Nitratireductor indicus C115 TaxID=1231190 RepID=K2PTW4_9HYPH|nr:IclR family transcriptional regulator [Nitratireductor indicus]EKF44512.1 regulatory protein, IclR [Nitratireductor indicus C115]SFQ30770.1 transcriptional regulator, IclR family [Nitratireductor indicus]
MKKTSRSQENKDATGPLQKSLEVMRLVVRDPYFSPSVAQIAEALSLPRPTANRIISNLIKLGMLKREPKRSHLIEGDELLDMALSVIINAAHRGPRHDILLQLAEETKETCNVGIIANGRAMYVDRVEATWPLSLRLEAGSQVPLHCSAIGKVLLSQLQSKQQDKYIDTLALQKFTDNTIIDRDELRAELSRVSALGIAFDNEEYLDGVIGMAVPISLGEQKPALALAIAAPSARMKISDLRQHLPSLLSAAERLQLCYQ